MENLVFHRIFIVLLTIPATFAAIYAFAYLKFPANAVVIAFSIAAFAGLFFYLWRKEKTARLNIFYAAANAFGSPVAFDSYTASLARGGTQFDCSFPSGKYDTALKVSFYLPNLRHKFIIQHDSLGRKTLYGCGPTTSPNVPDDFLLSDDGSDFLSDLLKNKNITDEFYNYPKSMMTAFLLVFDDGGFELAWTPPANDQIDGFYQICQTASIFHDELKKLSQTS